MKRKMKPQLMTRVALMAALMALMGPLTFPLGPVPLSFINLLIFLSLYLLGRRPSLMSLFLYIGLGLIGLPVFSGFTGGPSKLLGPTGGYIIGYLTMALLTGYFVEVYKAYSLSILGMVLGQASCYILGTSWLALQLKLSFQAALMVGVYPFILGDLVKILLAAYLGPLLRTRLKKSRLYLD